MPQDSLPLIVVGAGGSTWFYGPPAALSHASAARLVGDGASLHGLPHWVTRKRVNPVYLSARCFSLVQHFKHGSTLRAVEWIEIVEVVSLDGEYAEVKLPDTSIEWWPRRELPDDVLPGDSLAVNVDTGTGIHLLPRIGGIEA